MAARNPRDLFPDRILRLRALPALPDPQGHVVYVMDNLFTGQKKNIEHWIGESS